MMEHPFITLFIIYTICKTAQTCVVRLLRHLNIRKAGWPPPHCDADGDFKPEPEEPTP